SGITQVLKFAGLYLSRPSVIVILLIRFVIYKFVLCRDVQVIVYCIRTSDEKRIGPYHPRHRLWQVFGVFSGSRVKTYRTGILQLRQYLILCSKNNTCLFPSGFINRFINQDRKSTRLNSSHVKISYAVFCLKKKKTK